jgi:hypothetical protein
MTLTNITCDLEPYIVCFGPTNTEALRNDAPRLLDALQDLLELPCVNTGRGIRGEDLKVLYSAIALLRKHRALP